MADVTFIQRSRIGRSIFLLRSKTLEVTTSSLRGKSSQSFPLRTISADYRLVAERFYSIIISPLLLAGFSAWCANVLFSYPGESWSTALVLYAILGFFGFGWIALRGVPRVELFVFFNHGQRLLFFIAREKHQAAECEAFLHELLDRIEMVRQGASPEEIRQRTRTPESSVRLPGPKPTRVPGPNESRWKLCLFAGAVSSGFQPLVRDMVLLHDWVLAVVLLSTMTALLFGVLSWAAKERLRYVALLGMALSLIAPILS